MVMTKGVNSFWKKGLIKGNTVGVHIRRGYKVMNQELFSY